MFQSTIVKKYITTQSKDELISKWGLFKSFFHDIGNQNRIRELKEEQFQEGFLDKLFVEVFGYIKKPLENYNLVTELKNPNDSRKVDGGIIFNEVVKCVIELKGTNTTDLGRVEVQAFSYKNNQPSCKYIVTSNFEKLRFYIEDATEFLEFNLFELTQDEFELMYLCLSSKSVESDIPLKLKSESVSQEDLITKKLYKDYSIFKRELFNNLTELNQGYDKLLLFKKSQKLLDRFLFLFFGEDKFLLPPNSVRLILDDWKDLLDKDVEISLYDRFKKYFGYLNTGFKGKRYDVFPYNGGLFKPDDVLDNILIDDELLYNHTKKLSEYDFESEVDVNILGHIFENSLNEIEEISNELISGEVVKSTSKRKKDGVFYTPKYITKYIVDNTIGKLCDEKKNELQINDEDYITDKKRIKKTIKGLSDKLNEYRNWLLELTICDPSCGSGAFLNQSLDFLIKEHRYVDELQSKLFGDSLILSDIENSILENNLFGVDINEESVEITKLSLWLRTAQPNRKLNSLSSNIKCGNSLIDEPIEGVENYFKWEEEFPKVFEKGGFDIVIGNPPYVDMRSIRSDDIKYFKENYKTASNRINLFGLFVEQSFNIMNVNSEYGMIIHRNLIRSNEYEKCRELILNNTELNSILSFKNGVFETVTGEMTTLTFSKKTKLNLKNKVSIYNYETQIDESVPVSYINQDIFNNCIGKRFNVYLTKEKANILYKYFKNVIPLGEISYTLQGIIAGDEKKFISHTKLNDKYKPIVRGRDINRYTSKNPYEYIYFIEGTKVLTRSRKRENFEHPEKILTQHVSGGIKAYLDESKLYYMQTINGTIISNENYSSKYILAQLNSKLIGFYYDNIFNIGAEFTTAVAIENLDLIPIKNISLKEQKPFIDKTETILNLNKELYSISNKYTNYLQSQLPIEKLTKKLQNWYELEFGEFIKELNKIIKKVGGEKLTRIQEMGWMEVFETKKEEVQILKTEIDKTDKEIDTMVYQLYNLTDDEIKIIESTT
jgi:hypothetical protein